MIIAQITDFHVTAPGELCFGRVPTNDQLREAVASLNALDPRPDVVIGTGDLTDRGTTEQYAALREIVSALEAPLYLIPGNHDRRDAFLAAFAHHHYLPRPGAPFVQYAIDTYPVRLVALDSTIPGDPAGRLCAERLEWVDRTLAADRQKPTLIFVHHPPFRTGIQWMDAIGLDGGRALEPIVARHPQVVRVACGHIHRAIQVAWGGTIASTMPSTCHQVALNLTGRGGFDMTLEPRAVQLHLWDPAYGLVSHLSFVSSHETFQPVRGRLVSEILEGFAHRYDELKRREYEARPAP
jgi:3',5'-cyclic AMP phosphodiesterase CpdA